MKSLRLLLIADSNNPEWVSVPLVSHNHSTALSRIHEVTLLTHGDNRAGIESCKNSYKQVRYITMPWLDKLEYWAFNHIFKRDFGSQALTLFTTPVVYLYLDKLSNLFSQVGRSKQETPPARMPDEVSEAAE